MNIYYDKNYNIDLGLLNYLHPFDGKKFAKVYQVIKDLPGIVIKSPGQPASLETIEQVATAAMKVQLKNKRYILSALEVPNIPLLPFWLIDRRILRPMRWGVAGTIAAAKDALAGQPSWNLSGGYHHANPAAAEGFCIYNDIAIAYQELTRQGLLTAADKILIVDIDAHHGNGNAASFMENKNITLLDIYNNDAYPQTLATKSRVNIGVPLHSGVTATEYLPALEKALGKLAGKYRLAFVVAGTDVLATDPLGGMRLTLDECVTRDKMVVEKLHALSIPLVILSGGGYSKESPMAIATSIAALYKY
jgi:histone deacetylase 11